ETITKSFREVQPVLDLNRRLIQQANDKHRSKIPVTWPRTSNGFVKLKPILPNSSAFTPISPRVSPASSSSGDLWPEMSPRGLNP
ncbi:protein early flowering 4, partial [Phtheirospermum japonicum]